MRFAALLLVLSSLAACASGTGGLAHPTVAPGGDDPAEAEPVPPPVEGTEYAVFRGDGTPASFDEIVAAAGDAEVVLFGEEHDDLTTHRLQSELLRQLFMEYNRPSPGGRPSPHGGSGAAASRSPGDREVVLSLEMFERDVQYVVDEYLADLITEDHFTTSARAWERYDTDYRPSVEFAKAHGVPVVAANAPRRYVNRASRLGSASLQELPAQARAFLPPLPHPVPSGAYTDEWNELMGEGAEYMSGTPMDGQALWDATMAHSIREVLEREERPLVLHLAGSFHVANHTGIPEVLDTYRPGTRQLVVVGRPAEALGTLPEELQGEGDFVILTRGAN